MDYCVTFKIEGRYVAGVKANSVEEAIELARDAYCDADFGELTDIEVRRSSSRTKTETSYGNMRKEQCKKEDTNGTQ